MFSHYLKVCQTYGICRDVSALASFVSIQVESEYAIFIMQPTITNVEGNLQNATGCLIHSIINGQTF